LSFDNDNFLQVFPCYLHKNNKINKLDAFGDRTSLELCFIFETNFFPKQRRQKIFVFVRVDQTVIEMKL